MTTLHSSPSTTNIRNTLPNNTITNTPNPNNTQQHPLNSYSSFTSSLRTSTSNLSLLSNASSTQSGIQSNGGGGGGSISTVIGIHRGAIDNTTITTRPPSEVMSKVRIILDSIGISVQPESTYRYRCIRPPASNTNTNTNTTEFETIGSEEYNITNPIYANDTSRDPAGEVRFSVELTRLSGLNDTYSLDIRRLKGNLRSYQFLYETIRDRAQLSS